jgi:HK97 family phage prohead protease
MQKRILLPFSFKAVDDGEGIFSGDANVTGIVDLGGDRTIPGAFLKDLQRRGPRRPLLWGHKGDEVLGTVELAEIVTGLRTSLRVTRGQLALGVQRAREAYELLKTTPGALGMSIGYDIAPGGSRFAKDSVREITEASIFEVSLVSIPMNQESRVDSVKARDAADLARSIKSLEHTTREMLLAARYPDPLDRYVAKISSSLSTLAAKLAA